MKIQPALVCATSLLSLFALSSCLQAPPTTPSLRVVDTAVSREGAAETRGRTDATAWEISRQANGWVMREVSETAVHVTPRAERWLRTAAEERPRASASPRPLPQEAPEEWQRLKRLVADNERAMAAMEAQAEALAEIVQDLRSRLETVVEPRPRPTPSPNAEPSRPPSGTK